MKKTVLAVWITVLVAAFLTGALTYPQIRDCLKGMAVSSLFRVLD